MEDPAGQARACRGCHYSGAVDTIDAKKAFHFQCLGCHKKQKKGPGSCAGCHMQ
jgi:hypothetical protein